MIDWLKVCIWIGVLLIHSIEVGKVEVEIIFFLNLILSHKIHINKIILKVDIFLPRDEIEFHVEKASGKSEYRRGIPFSPKKCWGKKVKFTPKNILKKWIFSIFVDMWIEKISGDQNNNPPKIANTAPIDNT